MRVIATSTYETKDVARCIHEFNDKKIRARCVKFAADRHTDHYGWSDYGIYIEWSTSPLKCGYCGKPIGMHDNDCRVEKLIAEYYRKASLP